MPTVKLATRSSGTPRSRIRSSFARAASSVSPIAMVAIVVFVISAGSRPSLSQCSSSTSSRWRTRAGSPNTLQPSAYWATIRRVFRSPLPPIRIGMSPRTGFGLLSAPAADWRVPSTVARSSVNIARAIRRWSSRRSKRSLSGGKSKP